MTKRATTPNRLTRRKRAPKRAASAATLSEASWASMLSGLYLLGSSSPTACVRAQRYAHRAAVCLALTHAPSVSRPAVIYKQLGDSAQKEFAKVRP